MVETILYAEATGLNVILVVLPSVRGLIFRNYLNSNMSPGLIELSLTSFACEAR
jgi:hypothetical protein